MANLKFQSRLFINLSLAFIVFFSLVLVFQYEREKNFKKQELESVLDNITELTHNYIIENDLIDSANYEALDEIKSINPRPNVRITVINLEGVIMYDSEVDDINTMENHLQRPEVQMSILKGSGANIRTSSTTGNSYYYYAKSFKGIYIRSAALYNVEIKGFLKAEMLFIFYMLFLFIFLWITILIITNKTGKTITRLKQFAIKLNNGQNVDDTVEFPKDELGVISKQIINIYKDLNNTKEKINIEKNKLYNHLLALNEGIAFFSKDKEQQLANNHFIQFLNIISDEPSISPEKMFNVTEFKPINKFVDNVLLNKIEFKENIFKEIKIRKADKYFNVRCIFYTDLSFEIVIKDVTKTEKQRLIKQQMTSNLAHELKTPVTTIMGYLETLKMNNLKDEQKKHFISKAFKQSKRLSELVEDISILNKIDEAKDYYSFNEVNLYKVYNEVFDSLKQNLSENNVKINSNLKEDSILSGNESLLFSIFYNLFDNAIKYGGENISIDITNYLEDEQAYYFNFSNTGNIIDQKHLDRIFERFYRVDSGRSRKTGGTGLGLAIVKNAVEFHGGKISAKLKTGGGVEFLFSLNKKV